MTTSPPRPPSPPEGPAAGHKLLAPEGHAAVAAVAGLYSNFCFVDEHEKTGFRHPPLVFRAATTDGPEVDATSSQFTN